MTLYNQTCSKDSFGFGYFFMYVSLYEVSVDFILESILNEEGGVIKWTSDRGSQRKQWSNFVRFETCHRCCLHGMTFERHIIETMFQLFS